jgi:transcriptional regulator with XRE-family HTH domain
MGTKKEHEKNSSVYQTYRDKAGLTREAASEKMEYEHNYILDANRLYKIEKGKVTVNPDDVIALSKCYKAPELCNYYCSHECPIGQQYVPEVQLKELSQITLETVNALNNLEKQKNRLIEISVDGQITEDEFEDFESIQKNLRQIYKLSPLRGFPSCPIVAAYCTGKRFSICTTVFKPSV